jgi:hypothetical protein
MTLDDLAALAARFGLTLTPDQLNAWQKDIERRRPELERDLADPDAARARLERAVEEAEAKLALARAVRDAGLAKQKH